MEKQIKEIVPQKGYQHKALSSEADIVFGGGSAGAGKTYALLLDPLRGINTPGFTGMIFRRTTPQISLPGGLWDTSLNLYPAVGGEAIETKKKYVFPSGATIQMNHLEYEKNKLDHQGSQYAYIGFDEVTHFTKSQFLYLLSRNRSTCGIKPYVRATCNPDPESWVKELIERWIDDDGFPIEERDGVIRYFVNDKGNISWGDTKEEVIENNRHIFDVLPKEEHDNMVMSLTFIAGRLEDNKELLAKDPTYKAKLLALPELEQKALLYGCWKPVQNDLALVNYDMLNSIYSNYPKTLDKNYITCDVARFGRDLAVIAVWEGYKIIKMKIFKKSALDDLYKEIEKDRKQYNIPTAQTLIDQDGVGGGLVDMGKYMGFSGGTPAVEDPDTEIKEYYKNLKTQCYYRIIENQINTGDFAIDSTNIWVDGINTTEIVLNKKPRDVLQLIKDDIKAIHRAKIDVEGKLQINPKEEQKNILGRSPDFGDMIMMREWFTLNDKSSDFWMV